MIRPFGAAGTAYWLILACTARCCCGPRWCKRSTKEIYTLVTSRPCAVSTDTARTIPYSDRHAVMQCLSTYHGMVCNGTCYQTEESSREPLSLCALQPDYVGARSRTVLHILHPAWHQNKHALKAQTHGVYDAYADSASAVGRGEAVTYRAQERRSGGVAGVDGPLRHGVSAGLVARWQNIGAGRFRLGARQRMPIRYDCTRYAATFARRAGFIRSAQHRLFARWQSRCVGRRRWLYLAVGCGDGQSGCHFRRLQLRHQQPEL